MAAQEIKVPDIGDFDAVEVIEVLVSEGDEVEQEQALITLESDKATLEVPSTGAGRISELKIKEGDNVSEGDVIAVLDPAGDSAGEADNAPAQADDDTRAQDTGESSETDDAGGSSSGSAGEDVDGGQSAGGGGSVEVKVPDIGDFDTVEVIEVLVAEGDDVDEEQPLITLESDKATLEVPSTTAGRISDLKIKEGDSVSEGDVIAVLQQAADAGSADSAPSSTQTEQSKKQQDKDTATGKAEQPRRDTVRAPAATQGTSDTSALKAVDEDDFSRAHASPSVRKYARQLGADLGRIQGSGRKGRILEEDVQAHVRRALEQSRGSGVDTAAAGGGDVPAQPDIDFSKFGEVETVELERIRKLSAKAVHRNWLLIPHVTQFDQADITEMEAFRKANKEAAAREGIKLTPLAFMLKASAAALKAFPDMNSSLTADGEHLVHKKYCHIAVAVDTPGGLMMPVIRDVDHKGIYALASELDDISARARNGKLKSNEMQGACFSISSLGGVGGDAFTPIVNSPEVAILGVSRHSWQPVWQDGAFVPRLMLPLSLSYDHRVIDGAKAARITGFLSRALGDLRTLLL